MSYLGADEHACAHARAALRAAKEELRPLADDLFHSRRGAKKEEREAIARRINSAISKLTTAQHWLGVYD